MKAFLVLSQFACLVSLLLSTPKPYRLTIAYLLAVIPATLAFQTDAGWLAVWYPRLAGPVALLRLAAGLECAHRQTEGFRYWWRLMGSVFLIAGMFAGLAWVQSANPDGLRSVVEFRRLLQIFLAACFLVLELFWISQGGGLYRRSDQIAALFGVLAFNHGVVSFLAGMDQYSEFTGWLNASGGAWMVDGLVYCLLTIRFSCGVRSAQGAQASSRSLLGGTRSRVSGL